MKRFLFGLLLIDLPVLLIVAIIGWKNGYIETYETITEWRMTHLWSFIPSILLLFFLIKRRKMTNIKSILTGEWIIDKTNAQQRRVIHYWATIIWFTAGFVIWFSLRDALWFVGFMSLYAIWVTHIAGWAAETPVESENKK